MIEPRTYRREHVVEARRRWQDGEFDPAWEPYRKLAANRGFIFPPAGSMHDSVDDESPSQRAIIWRAIEDTPKLLARAIGWSGNWNDVVRILMGEVRKMREDAGLEEQLTVADQASYPTKRQAAERIGSILGRIER